MFIWDFIITYWRGIDLGIGVYMGLLKAWQQRKGFLVHFAKKSFSFYGYYVSGYYSRLTTASLEMVSNVYGWKKWGSTHARQYWITQLTKKGWLMACISTIGSTVLLVQWSRYWEGQHAYWDAFFAMSAVIANLLLTMKKLEGWAFYLGAHIGYMALNFWDGHQATAFKYSFYLLIDLYAIYQWYALSKANPKVTQSNTSHK